MKKSLRSWCVLSASVVKKSRNYKEERIMRENQPYQPPRPFIVDLVDTRLVYKEPRKYTFAFKTGGGNPPAALYVTVTYHLLDEKRRKKIGYENKEPISYPIYQKSIKLR